MKVRYGFLLLVITLFAGLLSAYAQVDYSTATLRGVVVDPQGAVIAGATITVANAAAGVIRSTTSGADGTYRVQAIPPGTYQITVTAQGFSKEEAKGIELTVGQLASYDAHMKVGSATETVEVSPDSVPLIQTDQTQQANTINQLQVEDLPNITHSITQQVYTLPGVANSDGPRSQQPGFTGFGTTGFSIGGSNGRNNLSTIDGGENEYGTGQYRVTTIPQDTIQEYQVNRSAFAAEFGFTDGSAINIVTKSGGNQFHGTGYGQFQNHDTSAQNFFNGIEGLPAAYNQNIYAGFTVGGPIKHDKLFFFLGYEYRDLVNPDYTNANILNAPTVQGIAAPGLGAACTSATSITSNQLCYINALGASGLPGAAQAASDLKQSLTPLSNPFLSKILTAENGVFLNPFRYHNTLLRFDATPDNNNSLNLRLEYSHDDSNVGNPDASGLFTRDFSILGTWNHSFSPSVLNQVLVQLVPRNVANNNPNSPFQGTNFSLGTLNVGNLGGTSTFGSPSLVPYDAHQQRYQFEDNLTWNHGNHSFKFGASMRLADYTITDALWFNNEFDFSDGVLPIIESPSPLLFGPGRSLADQTAIATFDFVAQNVLHIGNFGCNPAVPAAPCVGPAGVNLSAPESFNSGLPVDVLAGFHNPTWTGWGKYFGSYAQDSWKINSRLTVDGGVRFDVDGEPSPMSTNFYASPRLGLAWDPFGDHKTVVRAGGGVYYAPIDVLIPSYGNLLNGQGNYINEVVSILSATNLQPAELWGLGIAKGELPFGKLTPADFAAVGINTTTPGASVAYGIAPNYKNPYTVQASLSVDRQLGRSYSLELGYLMYHGVHLTMPFDTALSQINPGNPLCPTAACTDATGGPLYTLNSTQLQHTVYESIGSSIYHAMTASLTKRYSNNLQFQVNYTWSKSIDNVIDFASFDNWFRPSDLPAYRATSVFDIPQLLVANAVYTTPFKGGSGNILKSIFADISLAPIETWQSGLPFSVLTPGLQNVVNPVTGTLSTGLDQNFATPFGASRDSLRGPAYANTDLNFTKSFFINRDRGVKVNFTATATNLFNRVNFDRVSQDFSQGIPAPVTPSCPPGACVQTADGVVNLVTGPFTGLQGVRPTSPNQINQPLFFSAANLPRQIQLGLKFVF